MLLIKRRRAQEKFKAREHVENNPDQCSNNRPSNTASKNSRSSTTRQLPTKDRINTKETTQSNNHNNNKSSNIFLIGDSILHGINLKGLKRNVHKHSVSGAKINTILGDIKMFDLKTFSSVIIYIGGNDVANVSDFEEKYDQLLRYIKKENVNCKVILSNIGPRRDVQDCENTQLNDIIHELTREYGCNR